MVGHSNLGFADALRARRGRAASSRYVGIRHEGAAAFAASRLRQAHRPPRGVLRDRRTGLDQPAHRPVRRQGRRRAGARDLRAGAVEGAGPGRVPGPRPVGGVPRRRGLHGDRARGLRPRRARRHRGQARARRARRRPPRAARRGAGPARRTRPPRGRTAGRADLRIAPPAARRRARPAPRPPAAGGHRRARRARAPTDAVRALAERLGAPVLTTFRAKGLVPDDHPLGAGVLGRSGTPVASLADERVRPAARGRRLVLQPHRHRGVQADRAGRRRARRRSAASTRSTSAVLGDAGVTLRRARWPRLGTRRRAVDQRPDVAARWAIWRAEKARRAARRPRPGRGERRRLRRADRALPDRRGDRGRRRQPRLLLRPLLRERGPARAHVRATSARSGSASPRPWAPGLADPDRPGRGGDRRRRLRPVPRRADHRRQVRHAGQARAARQRRARQDQQGAAGRAVPGVADLAGQPRLRRPTPGCAAPPASRCTAPTSSTTA